MMYWVFLSSRQRAIKADSEEEAAKIAVEKWKEDIVPDDTIVWEVSAKAIEVLERVKE